MVLDSTSFKHEVLVLENDKTFPKISLKEAMNLEPNEVDAICNLTEKSPEEIFKQIMTHKTIFIKTIGLDKNQIEQFVNLFNLIDSPKNVIIKTYQKGKENITSTRGFKEVSHKHNIKFA